MLEAQLQVSDDNDLLFTTPTGRMWRERSFYRDLWRPAQEVSGLDIRPHECRHSYVTHLRAVGVNDADLAEIAGRRVETMLARYTHAIGQSFSDVRTVVGMTCTDLLPETLKFNLRVSLAMHFLSEALDVPSATLVAPT
jgi:site-specific recombinase XerD